jgi:hypothetical protein
VPESVYEARFARSRRRGLSAWGSWLARSENIVLICTVLTVVLTALTLHSFLVTGGIAIAGGGWAVAVFVVSARDPDRRREKTLSKLADQIEEGPPGVPPPGKDGEPLPQVKVSKQLVDALEKRLEENEELCVIRLRGKDILEAPPGIAENAIPEAIECQRIVGAISWKLEKAPGLSKYERDVAADLRGVVSSSLRESDPMARLRQEVVHTLRVYELTGELVPLVDARPEVLDRPVTKWLLKLFEELGCRYGFFTESDIEPPPPDRQHANRLEARRYVSGTLSRWLSEQEFEEIFASLCAAAGDRQVVDLRLLRIRCAVIAAAVEIGEGEEAEPMERLRHPVPLSSSSPEDRARDAAALEVRWLIDRKAARIARVRDLTGVCDRLTVIDKVTPMMFGELLQDLGLGPEGTRELYDWLRGDELRLAGIVESTEDAISLSRIIRDGIMTWLRDDQQSAEYQKAQVAAERYYRVCLVLNRAHVPAPGYADWVAPGYAGLHLFEIADWWANVYAWSGHVAEIDSPEHRKDAGVAITCLFLETWWWWGDQVRLEFIDKVLDVARTILRDQPEWFSALQEFDQNYEPDLNLRAAAGDQWGHVAKALGYLADNLGLRQGEIPASDPVLARIYVCWCFFSGDVAQQTGNLEAADAWFRDAAEGCGDDADNAAMRAFARYQQADVWIPSDTERSMRLITENRLADAAVELDGLSLRAYVARMYADIRWKSGDIRGAFDAYGRALLLTYVYQVDQEVEKMPPSAYSYALYTEMRARLIRRLAEARSTGNVSEADGAIERITKLFGPYWELKRAAAASGEDPLAGVVPPLPDETVLGARESSYVRDALLMLNDKLKEQIAEPVDQLLRDPEDASPAVTPGQVTSPAQ